LTYRPLDKAEIEEGLRAEVLELQQNLRTYFTVVAVEIHQVKCDGFPHAPPVFVVARSGSKAIFYDDVEEDFGIGTVDGDTLKDCSLIGELRYALVQLQGGRDDERS
jgi:hypothetical protein